MQVGWPVFTARASVRAAEIAVELSSGTQPGFELALLIPSERAASLVDHALGGNGESGLAARAGALSDGECGVLAYLASRVCRELPPLQVRDVHAAPRLDACVLWPLTLHGALGSVALTCALAPWRAQEMRDRHRLTVSVFDRGPLAFQAGDVWIGDRWNLSSASNGLAGEVQLSVEGCASRLAALLGNGALRAWGPSSEHDQLELVLSELALPFADLARIAAGEPHPISLAQQVELRSAGSTLARGELVSWRGAIGVRISEA